MINFGGGIPFFLGIFLVLCGVALYALRSYRPQLARDHDIFFAAISSISGFILMFQGWQLNPILQLGQVAIAGSAVFFVVENIRLRGITTEQAKRSTPIDEDRPVSRDYDYEDNYGPRNAQYRSDYDEFSSGKDRSRRIPSGRSGRAVRDEWDTYREEPRRVAARRDWREDERYDDGRYDDGRYNEGRYNYDERPGRRLSRAPRRDDAVVVDATWDEPSRPSVREQPRRDSYRAIPPSRDGDRAERRVDGRDRYPNVSAPSSPPGYDDEPPVINATYANYRPADSKDDGDNSEEDNSGYQNLY